MIADKRPDIAHLGEVALDFERPALERGFAFPQQTVVAMNKQAVLVVFGGVIAQQSQVNEVSGKRQKLEWRQIAFVQRRGVRPDPGDAAFLEQTDNLRPVPPGMPELDREAKVPRQLDKKFAQRRLAVFWRERGRQLDEHDLELGRERLDGAQK